MGAETHGLAEHKGTYAVRPLLYFDADWELDRYDLCGDAHVIRATPEIVEDTDSQAAEAGIAWPERHFEWLFVTSTFAECQRIPPVEIADNDVGRRVFALPFQGTVLNESARTLLTALNVVKFNGTAAPLAFEADIELWGNGAAVHDVRWPRSYQPGGIVDTDYLPATWDEEGRFSEREAHVLAEVYESIYLLRGMAELPKQLSYERFLPWQEGAMDARHGLLSASADDRKGQMGYACALWQEFLAELREYTINSTRVGRALGIFEEALRMAIATPPPPWRNRSPVLLDDFFVPAEVRLLPDLQLPVGSSGAISSFLLMCVVLESLFTLEHEPVKYKLAHRLAVLLCGKNRTGDRGKYLQYRRRAEDVYAERSCVVHGVKLVEQVPEEVRKDAFLLARECLERVLRDEDILAAYSVPDTKDTLYRPDEMGVRLLFLKWDKEAQA